MVHDVRAHIVEGQGYRDEDKAEKSYFWASFFCLILFHRLKDKKLLLFFNILPQISDLNERERLCLFIDIIDLRKQWKSESWNPKIAIVVVIITKNGNLFCSVQDTLSAAINLPLISKVTRGNRFLEQMEKSIEEKNVFAQRKVPY